VEVLAVDGELAQLEHAIDAGLATFVQVGEALTRIRDERLYRDAGHDTFEAYMRQRWHLSRHTGYLYLQAAEVARDVYPDTQPPSLTHARLLHALPSAERAQVAAEIAREHLTVKALRRVIADKQRQNELRAPAPPMPIVAGALPSTCQIEVGDARQLPLEDNSAQLWIASPPYNARLTYQGYEDWLPWTDYWHGLIEPALREAYRVLGPGGRLCLNMANVVRQDVPVPGRNGRPTQYQSRNHPWKWKPPGAAAGESWAVMLAPRVWSLLEQIGFLPREQLTWVKGSPSEDEDVTATPTSSTAWGTWCSAENPVLRAVAEPIFIASKGSHGRGPGPSDLEPSEFKRFTKNVWFVSALKPDLDHPSAFPAELPRRLIKLYSYPGDLVVDPFVGSGTTCLAAARLGRWSYGCDISAHYVALARARLSTLAEGTV
jgi:site-specific DNA-methyltransferase (adenine-specific)